MNDFLWVEKYRPKTVSETILPEKLKNIFLSIVKSGEVPNMLFSGTAGLGKTTVAKAICNEIGLDYILINGSEEGNIDTLRNKIRQFASTISLSGHVKVVILDEADYLNASSFQPALRGFIEEFTNNCRFILTCNFKNRIIQQIHSRCSVFEFNVSKKEMITLKAEFMKRLVYILKKENVEFDKDAIAGLIVKYGPDWRRILNEVQSISMLGGIINENVIISHTKFKELFEFLKAKDFRKTRQWVVNNLDTDTTSILRGIYDEMLAFVKPSSIPQLVLIIADYQYKAAFVADQEVNMVACMVEIMADIEFI